MTDFASKQAPSATKLRGGYYTPDPIASYLADWVGQGGRRLLEPSCGDGAILKHMVRGRQRDVLGVELVAEEAKAARFASGGRATVVQGDFFHWFQPEQEGTWDGVAGNPPYIRFGNWPESDRTLAFDLMEKCGLRATRLTNAWVPFTVAAVRALREGGRVGLVLPAELLQVSYAAQLRNFLLSELADVRIISFRSLIFPDILQEVVLLLGIRGAGPTHIRTAEVDGADDLDSIQWEKLPTAPTLRHDREKWTKFFLLPEQIETMRWAREEGGLQELGQTARVEVGVVTGRNSFFTMTPTEAESRGVAHLCRPLVARSSQIEGLVFDELLLQKQMANDVRCLLLSVSSDTDLAQDSSLSEYVRIGEEAEVHKGYKCGIRTPWWVVPSVWRPDGFMLRQIHTHPMLIANRTEATSTDTVHRVRLKVGVDVERLAASLINSATFAFSEVMGRSYGGGILELEPSEAQALLVPPIDKVPENLVADLHELLCRGELLRALDIGDQKILVDGCGWEPKRVRDLRDAWTRLRDRRSQRGKSSKNGS